MATKKNTAIKRGDKEYSYYRITRTVVTNGKTARRFRLRNSSPEPVKGMQRKNTKNGEKRKRIKIKQS